MKSFLSLVVAGLVILIGYLAGVSDTGAPHSFSGQCQTCHLGTPKKGQKIVFVQDVDFLCYRCHEMDNANSHPSEVVPSMKLPPGFTTDWQGRITCSTCHEIHSGESASNKNMLKGKERGKKFCLQCHKDLFSNLRRHLEASKVAHSKRSTASERQILGGLDRVSVGCLGCHDGVVGPAAGFTTTDGSGVAFLGENFSHPMGMNYARSAARNRRLRPVGELSGKISLYEGKVGCTSCHSPYSKERAMLVISNKRSSLCFECHLK